MRTWLCLHLPWHKLRVTQRAKEPYTSKLVTCSCKRKYVMHDRTKSFLPYNDDFAEFFTKELT